MLTDLTDGGAVTLEELQETLAHLRQLGTDHYSCEVKKARGGIPTSLWESISAFANAQGGTIILGVEEKNDFSIVGVSNPAAFESQLGSICSEMEPPVRADIRTFSTEGESVVACYVPPTPRDQRPCHKKSLGPWAGSRIRVSDGDRKLTDYEISLLLSNRTEQRHDLTPIAGASLEDLDDDLIQAFIRRIRDTKGEIFRKVDNNRLLRMLNVIVDHHGKMVPTLAGLLAFGIYPQTFEPQLDITFVAYPTSEPGVLGPSRERFTENRSIDGPIPTMVNECIRLLKRNMKRRSIVSGIYRVDEWEYPEEVLREALVNALVHRDYSEYARGMQVQVEMYPDRLIIRNPGGLYGPVDVSTLGTTTISSSRNKALLKILEDTPFFNNHMVCENRGSGITRILVALNEAGMEPPRFIDEISSFAAEFPNHTLLDEEALSWLQSIDNRPLSRSQMTALVMMRNGIPMNNASYRSATGIQDSRAAGKELKDLVDRGIIRQKGTRGAATYHLASSIEESGNESCLPLMGDQDGIPSEHEDEEGKSTNPPPELSPNQLLIMETLGNEELSRRELERKTGLNRNQVIPSLQNLRSKGLVELVGKPRSKNSRWRRSSE